LHGGIYAMADNRILVTKAALRENDHADWNAFIQLLALTDYDELAPQQRAAHLVFWYESEVQNGGHLQYSPITLMSEVRRRSDHSSNSARAAMHGYSNKL
jgi:hypothetical protein